MFNPRVPINKSPVAACSSRPRGFR